MREFTYQLSRDVTLHSDVDLALVCCEQWQREYPDDWDETCEWGVSSGWTYNQTLRWLDEHGVTIVHFDQNKPYECELFVDDEFKEKFCYTSLIMSIDAAILKALEMI